jgi:hypothetical protein
MMTDRYKQGWNDRVRKTSDDYGKAFLTVDGRHVANSREARDWSEAERADYVRGWTEAEAKILTLELP